MSALPSEGEIPYDGLLGDYDFGLRTDELRRVFGELAAALPPLVAEAQLRSPRRALQVPVSAQRAAVAGALRRLGVDSGSWRVDVSAHPFTAWIGRRDTRVTTRYSDGNVESLLSSLHEYGHALYERQIDPALERTNLGRGTSMSIHESQSKLWENHVARNPAFAEVLAAELARGGFAVAAAELHAALVGVEPSADPRVRRPAHLPAAHRPALRARARADRRRARRRRSARRMARRDAPPARRRGPLRRARLPAGRALGRRQLRLLPQLCARLPDRRSAVGGDARPSSGRARMICDAGEVAPIQRWLAEHVHRHGRRLDTLPLVEQATGAPLEVEPFLRYVGPLAGR